MTRWTVNHPVTQRSRVSDKSQHPSADRQRVGLQGVSSFQSTRVHARHGSAQSRELRVLVWQDAKPESGDFGARSLRPTCYRLGLPAATLAREPRRASRVAPTG